MGAHKGRRITNRYELCPDGRTALLYLTQGIVTLIDAKDLPYVLTHRWNALSGRSGPYVKSKSHGGLKLLHRFLIGAAPDQQVDHKNHNSLDNRRANLRLATPSQNNANRHVQQTGRVKSSRFKGVYWQTHRRVWCASIRCQHRRYFRRGFPTEEMAALWYNQKARVLFGDFALLNAVDA